MEGYGVCFEFGAESDKAAEAVRADIQARLAELVKEQPIREVTVPSWYRFNTLRTRFLQDAKV